MATRRFSINPQDQYYQVTEAVGSATATKAIEVTVDLAVLTDSSDKGKMAVVRGIQGLSDYILRSNWPPA